MSATGVLEYGGRTVWVHLPPGYDPDRLVPYPLFVLHDGQHLFARRPDPVGRTWRADDAVDRLTAAGAIAPIVIAGIDHAGPGREREFTPPALQVSRSRPAREYARVIHDEIIPGLARDLYVHTDPDGLALGGAAMGAIVTLWMAALYPGRFSRLLLLSPALAWKRRAILRMLETTPIDPSTKIWVHAGPGAGGGSTRDTRVLCDRLRDTGCRHVRYVEDTDARHDEESWAERLPEALAWLYGPPGA